MGDTSSYGIAIQEMHAHLERQYQGIDALKSIARTLLSTASLIIAFIGAFQLANAQVSSSYLGEFNSLLVIALGLYIALIAACVSVLSPAGMKGPIKPDWPSVYSAFFEKTSDDIVAMQLSAYLNAIKLNAPIIAKRKKLATGASVLLPLIVVVLLGLSLITGLE